MYGWKLLAVATLVTALLVGVTSPTVAQTPATPHHGAAVTGTAPMVGMMPMHGAPARMAYNPCCCPMYPAYGMAMGYPTSSPMMASSSYYTPQPRRRLFNRSRTERTYVSGPTYPYGPTTSMPYMMPPTAAPVAGAPVNVAATASVPATTVPATGTTAPAPPAVTRAGDGTLPLATVPPGYFMTVNGQLVPTTGSSFYYYPMEPVQTDSPRRFLRLFRR